MNSKVNNLSTDAPSTDHPGSSIVVPRSFIKKSKTLCSRFLQYFSLTSTLRDGKVYIV